MWGDVPLVSRYVVFLHRNREVGMEKLCRGHLVGLKEEASDYWKGVLGQPLARKKGLEVVAQVNNEEVEVRTREGIQRVPVTIVNLIGGRPKRPLED